MATSKQYLYSPKEGWREMSIERDAEALFLGGRSTSCLL
jgi:hypothetical protein